MKKTLRFSLVASLLSLYPLVGLHSVAQASQFKESTQFNQTFTSRFNYSTFFTLPKSSMLPLPNEIPLLGQIRGTQTVPGDALVDYVHPQNQGLPTQTGLRVLYTRSRATLASQLAASGLVQTGDIILTARPEWSGAGAYPSIQMGVSHSSLAIVKDGKVLNIDNPLSSEYLGSLNSPHFNETQMLHVIRPRGLTPAQRQNIATWAQLLLKNQSLVYPRHLSFNQDYMAPRYRAGKPLFFVRNLGRMALASEVVGAQRENRVPSIPALRNTQAIITALAALAPPTEPAPPADPNDPVAPPVVLPPTDANGFPMIDEAVLGRARMYCSEFVWSLLALRNCDPNQPQAFLRNAVPRCVQPLFAPVPSLGNLVGASKEQLADPAFRTQAQLGLAEGPVVAIDGLDISVSHKLERLNEVFTTSSTSLSRMSPGHRGVAEKMAPAFAPLQAYFGALLSGQGAAPEVAQARAELNSKLLPNYTPTSFLSQTLLPHESTHRKMDYVVSIVIEDQAK